MISDPLTIPGRRDMTPESPAGEQLDSEGTYGACWGCGTKGHWMRVLGDNLLCPDCRNGIMRVNPRLAGKIIREHWAELRKLEQKT
jgi:hypothetical protein